MGKKITPPKTPYIRKTILAKSAILIGISLLLLGIYKLYQTKGPTFSTNKIPAPKTDQQTIFSNASQVKIKGKTIKKGIVIAFLNDHPLTEAVADPLGYFELPATFSEDGIYKLQLKTLKNIGIKLVSKQESEVTIIIDRQAPILSNIKIMKYPNKLNIQGTISENAKIFVHEGSTRLAEKELSKGNFNINVSLSKPVRNHLYIFALDNAGNTSKPLKVTVMRSIQTSIKQNTSRELPNSAGLADIAINALKEKILVSYLLILGLTLYISGNLIKKE